MISDITKTERKKLKTAATTLRVWYRSEEGYPNEHPPWRVEREVGTGLPYAVFYSKSGGCYRKRTPDREKVSLETINEICSRRDVKYHIVRTSDGSVLYISDKPLTEKNYFYEGVAL